MINTHMLVSPVGRLRTLDRTLGNLRSEVTGHVWVPAMDVAERRDSYVVLVELPGVNPAQVDLHFEQNVLTVSGTKQSAFDPSTHQEIRLFAAERANGEFSRSVRLPDVADADGISATFTNGLLTVTVPKAKAAQPRKIGIEVHSQPAPDSSN